MDTLFLTILNMSLTGAFVIAAIILARQFLKKAPKIISYVLWAVVGFRLVFPFSIESIFSLIPFNSAPIPMDIAMQPLPGIDSGIPIINNSVNSILPAATPHFSANPLQIWVAIIAWAWFLGFAVMVIYGIVSFAILNNKMKKSTHIEGNIYESGFIKSPFVLGIFSPKIYLPAGLLPHERGYILLHEQTHIRRHDHIVKLMAFFILCLHWFNPLAWLAFLLMGADMEMSCDEEVMKELGGDITADYSMSLVRIATGRRILSGSPLAFGEGGTKERVKRVLNFKKPSRVIIVAAIALTAILSLGFAMNRAAGAPLENDELYTMEIVYVDNPASFLPEMRLIWDGDVYYVTSMPEAERGRLIGHVSGELSDWNIYEVAGRGHDYLYAVESENVWRIMSTSPPESPIQLYILENATERQRLERTLSISLYQDGTARISIAPISSFMLSHPLFYAIAGDELIIHCADNYIIVRFDIDDDGALIFRHSSRQLFIDENARYVPMLELPREVYLNEMSSEDYAFIDNTIVQYVYIPEIAPSKAVPIARVWMGDGVRYDIEAEARQGYRILTALRPCYTDTDINGLWFHSSVSPDNPRLATIPVQFNNSNFANNLDGYYYLFVGNNSSGLMSGVSVRITSMDSQARIELLDTQ